LKDHYIIYLRKSNEKLRSVQTHLEEIAIIAKTLITIATLR